MLRGWRCDRMAQIGEIALAGHGAAPHFEGWGAFTWQSTFGLTPT